MEDIVKLLEQMREDIKDIKSKVTNNCEEVKIVKLLEQMREDIKDIKSKVTNNCEEVKSMREEIISMQENWNKERKELKNELYETKEE
ncbi:hypothetical protein QE152_g35783 [Popillia japonica]|uniref:Uncharacterized protein n=1 Tax=Popillia japonica TaxID=7064 RepID=A0AAW1IEP6_POPJA